jgi:hypothetical protein
MRAKGRGARGKGSVEVDICRRRIEGRLGKSGGKRVKGERGGDSCEREKGRG